VVHNGFDRAAKRARSKDLSDRTPITRKMMLQMTHSTESALGEGRGGRSGFSIQIPDTIRATACAIIADGVGDFAMVPRSVKYVGQMLVG
jgi:hypothetical protein